MSLFVCPLCGAPLRRESSRYVCHARHSFDIAREGYAHLLPVQHKHSRMPGDDKGMAKARQLFLHRGWYAPLRDVLCKLSVSLAGDAPCVLDAGCGEGWYTGAVFRALSAAGRQVQMAGVDISKHSVRLAARSVPEVEFVVASSYRLPVADGSIELLLDCFSPLALDEFRRVLRPGGSFLYVVPGEKHLWELKELLYERPYPNEVKAIPYEGFRYREIRPVETRLHLPSQEDIHALFQMTPYYWKTPKAGAARLAAQESLDVTASFSVHVFERV